jgi:hypothetical protein
MRPLIELMSIVSDDNVTVKIFVRLSACPGATGRPSEVLDHMGIIAKNINRKGLLFVDNDD